MSQLALRIGIDLMGGDLPPFTLFTEFFLYTQKIIQPCHFSIFVNKETCVLIDNYLVTNKPKTHTYSCISCKEIISAHSSPLRAVRLYPESSMSKGLRYARNGAIESFISVGNTGALVSGATLLLPRNTRLTKIALLAAVPTSRGVTYCTDVGARVMPSLFSFSHTLYNALQFFSVLHKKKAKAGVLNIGSESTKGGRYQKELHRILSKFTKGKYSNYIESVNNVESSHIFNGDVDIVFTEGFAGNVFLKTSEAVFDICAAQINAAGGDSAPLNKFKTSSQAGALLLGCTHNIFKCHGASTGENIAATVSFAIQCATTQPPSKQ